MRGRRRPLKAKTIDLAAFRQRRAKNLGFRGRPRAARKGTLASTVAGVPADLVMRRLTAPPGKTAPDDLSKPAAGDLK